MNNKHIKKKLRSCEILCALLPVGFVCMFGSKYVLLPSIDKNYAQTKERIMYDEVTSYGQEGEYLDRNGNSILSDSYAPSPENYSYAYLLGYYTVNNEQINAYGLRGNLKDYTWFQLDSFDKGATVRLTTDNALQNYCYSLLNGDEGSITVLDSQTGEIMALASQSTIDYDVNNSQSFVSSTIPDAQFRRGTYENDPPGSTFKVITAAAALEKQEEEELGDDFLQYNDTGSYLPDGDSWTITNYNDEIYGNCDLNTAMQYSINCYFAHLGIEIGAERLKQKAEQFYFGKDIQIPFLCTLHSSIDIEEGSSGSISQTSFGQGNTEVSPLQLAMVAQAISNNGDMMRPYIVKSVANSSRTFYKGKQEKLSSTMNSSVNEKLKIAMHAAAEEYGLYESYYGMVYAKTGTAECANDRIHCYMIGCTDSYAFCISLNNARISTQLYGTAQQLVSYLNQSGY